MTPRTLPHISASVVLAVCLLAGSSASATGLLGDIMDITGAVGSTSGVTVADPGVEYSGSLVEKFSFAKYDPGLVPPGSAMTTKEPLLSAPMTRLSGVTVIQGRSMCAFEISSWLPPRLFTRNCALDCLNCSTCMVIAVRSRLS